jgi:uncharacterized protein YbjQ (UPF0145 family)
MIDLIIFLALLTIGYISGSVIEKKHFKSIREREAQLRSIQVIGSKRVPERFDKVDSQLVQGSVVISIDYFKKIAAGLRSFFGGRVSSYETLVDRARREAVLRMKEEAANWGAQVVFNLRIETASVSQGAKGQVGAVEVYAYGTALKSTKAQQS